MLLMLKRLNISDAFSDLAYNKTSGKLLILIAINRFRLIDIYCTFSSEFLSTLVFLFPDNKVDGNWGSWSDVTGCTFPCGGGTQQRTRLCNNPPAQEGGLECLLTGQNGQRGKEENVAQPCNEQPCPGKEFRLF